MPIIGIDPSLTATGISVWSDKELKLLSLHTVKSDPKTGHLYIRVQRILDKILSLDIDNVEILAIEGISFGSFGRGYSNLCELQGIIRNTLWLKGKKVLIFPPSTVKKHLTGKGNTQKNMIPMAAQKKYGNLLIESNLEILDDNQADALAIGHLGWLFHQKELGTKITKEETERLSMGTIYFGKEYISKEK